MPSPVMNAGSDVTLAFGAIPTSQPLTGGATVFAPGTAITSWLWTLLEKPAGSAAALSSTAVQNPTLNGIDTVGTYLLFLQGTDDAAQASESDRLRAPSSAFVTVSVTTQYAALDKPAPSQREWSDEYYGLVDAVDAQKNAIDTHIADTSDPHQTLAATATVSVTDDPAATEILVATSPTTAEWQAASSGLVPVSAVGTLGRIECTEAPFSAPNPKAVTRDKVQLGPLSALGTLKGTGFTPWEVDVPAAVVGVANTPSPYCIRFRVPYAMTITSATATMEDAGAPALDTYTIELRRLSTAELQANAAGTLLATLTITAGIGGAPAVTVSGSLGSVTAGSYIGAVVTASPTTPGGGLSIQLDGYQEF